MLGQERNDGLYPLIAQGVADLAKATAPLAVIDSIAVELVGTYTNIEKLDADFLRYILLQESPSPHLRVCAFSLRFRCQQHGGSSLALCPEQWAGAKGLERSALLLATQRTMLLMLWRNYRFKASLACFQDMAVSVAERGKPAHEHWQLVTILGEVLSDAGLFREARMCAMRGLRLATDSEDVENYQLSLMQYAEAVSHGGARGANWVLPLSMQQAVTLGRSKLDAVNGLLMLTTLARTSTLQGNQKKAQQYLSIARERITLAPPSVIAVILIEEGRYHATFAKTDVALSHLEEASWLLKSYPDLVADTQFNSLLKDMEAEQKHPVLKPQNISFSAERAFYANKYLMTYKELVQSVRYSAVVRQSYS